MDSRELVGVTVRDSHLRGPSEVSHSRKLSAGGEEAPEFFLMQPLLPGSGVFCAHFPLPPPFASPQRSFRLSLGTFGDACFDPVSGESSRYIH